MLDPFVVGWETEEWERLKQEEEDAFLSEVSDKVVEAFNVGNDLGAIELTDDARAVLTEAGWVVDLPMGNQTVRMYLEVVRESSRTAPVSGTETEVLRGE